MQRGIWVPFERQLISIMKSHATSAVRMALMLYSTALVAAPLQDPWNEGHAYLNATGPHVLGCWKFDELPLADASGHGALLALNGAAIGPQGRFGGALSCGVAVGGVRRAAVTTAALPRLSPIGAFSAEMWVRVAVDVSPTQPAHLLDKQGSQMQDYRWSLLPADELGRRRMSVNLGFGTFAKEFVSEPVFLPAREWRHLAFTYDAAGNVAFFLDSEAVGGAFAENCGPVLQGMQPLSIGDGLASAAGFPGDIDEVRLCDGVRGFASFALEVSGTRHVWQRMERPTPLKISLTNLLPRPLLGADMSYNIAGITQSFILPDLAPGTSHVVELGPDTALKPGTYMLEVVMGTGAQRVRKAKQFHIVTRSLPMLPLIMEGAREEDLPHLQALACTHWTGLTNVDAPYLGPNDRHHHLKVQPRMDAGLFSGLRTVAALAPWRVAMTDTRLHRINRDGKSYEPPDLDAFSGVAGLTGNSGQRLMVGFREYQTWAGVWLNAAPRSTSQPGFSAVEREAYRKFSGQDIPPEIQNGGGADWKTLAGFPTDRVLPDDHPILRYYRWFWSTGNGWKAANEAWYQGMDKRRQERTDVWTLHDPTVRQPSIAGADGMVNYFGDRTMDVRDPIMTGLCLDQLLAMGAAHSREIGIFGIMPLSWERETVSPFGAEGTAESIRLEDITAPARHISLSPAILKESLWMMLARPVKGLVCTGWPALRSAAGNVSPIRATHPQAYAAFRDVVDRVIRPLGPMLARRKPWRSPVVMLESFTSQMFAGRGLYRGTSPRTMKVWQALQHAHIQADIVYEEILAEGGLEGRDILIMTESDVLPASVVATLKQWQQDGGKIIADEHLCPALKADVLLSESAVPILPANPPEAPVPANSAPNPTPVTPPPAPLSLPERLAQICLDLGLQPRVTCDNPDVILHASSTGEATCLFVINNSREAGTYVGQHGLVKESGLAVTASLNLGSDSINVYDLTRSAFVLPKREVSGLTIPLKLGPAEGRVFLLSSAPLLEINLDLPETATCGNVAEARITLNTSGGRPMPAAIPVAVRIRDADGTPAEWDGHHVVEDGVLTLRLDLARNETPGTWEVQVRELASGIEVVKWMKVQRQ